MFLLWDLEFQKPAEPCASLGGKELGPVQKIGRFFIDENSRDITFTLELSSYGSPGLWAPNFSPGTAQSRPTLR